MPELDDVFAEALRRVPIRHPGRVYSLCDRSYGRWPFGPCEIDPEHLLPW